ncbi:MAG: type IV secretory system conjugative DNA transfer family protein [Gammaproteobacteria bacterium]
MNNYNKLDEFIDSHPRYALRILLIGFFLVWQSVVCLLGVCTYLVMIKCCRVQWWIPVVLGVIIPTFSIYFSMFHVDLVQFVLNGFKLNVTLCELLFSNHSGDFFNFLYEYEFNYLLGFPLLVAGGLSLIDLIPNNPHKLAMTALRNGIISNESIEISENEIDQALSKLKDENFDGTVLGVSKYTSAYSVISDRDINQVIMVLGTTGAGKTITLRRFYQRAIIQGYPLIIVDGKPDEGNITWLMQLAKKHNRQFFGFNCGNFLPYDPLANGGYTELKDKIICLKDEWSSDYYRSIAEDYLQTTLEVLLKAGKPFDMKKLVECLNYNELINMVRDINDSQLDKRVKSLENYDRKDITGLQAHLNILINSELGVYFEMNEMTFTLSDVIQQNGIVYFALPALKFPSFSKVLGKMVINDIKAVIDRNSDEGKKIFTVFDEFSVFAGEQVLNLVNMGRGKGVHAIFGTQGLADLDRVDPTFKAQVMNCVNTLICHRLNDQDSAEAVSNWVGTYDAFNVTAQINTKENDAAMGSVRRNKVFIIHPDSIKQGLRVGEAFYVTKVGGFEKDKVRVKFT